MSADTVVEFPKALYRNGDHLVVKDQAEEEVMREAGYDDWQADQDAIGAAAEAPTKPAKRAKAAE